MSTQQGRRWLATVRRQLILSVALVHAAMMALFVWDLTRRQQDLLLDRQLEQARAMAETLAVSASGWLASRDISGLQEIAEAQRHYPEVSFAMLLDTQGKILGHTDRSRLGLYVQDLPAKPEATVNSRTAELVDVIVPVYLAGHAVGWVRVGIGQQQAGATLSAITRDGILYALAAIALGSLLAGIIGTRITRKIYKIREASAALRAGHYEARVPALGDDEAGTLGRDFNAMVEALDAERARLRTLINTIPDLVWLKDRDGVYVLCNHTFERLFGARETAIAGRTDYDFVDREQADLFRANDRKAASAGQPTINQEWITFADDGRRALLETIKTPVVDADGRLQGVLGVARDITAMHEAQAALERHQDHLQDLVAERTAALEAARQNAEQNAAGARESAEHLRRLSLAVERVAGVRDLPALVALVRRAAREITGADGATVVLREGDSCRYHDEDGLAPGLHDRRWPMEACIAGWSMSRNERAAVADVFADPRIAADTYRDTPVASLAMVPIGRESPLGAIGCYWTRPHEATDEELDLQQALADAVAVALDNLELYGRLEVAWHEAERLARVKSEFLANMSHEIRTPLNGVLGLAQIGYRDNPQGAARETFARILDSGRLLLGIIDDILDFSKIEAGKLKVESVAIDPGRVLDETAELLEERARAKGIALTVEKAADLPSACLSDPLRLGQILMNLLSNAVKFTERGRVVVAAGREGGQLVFRVADTGIGMGPIELERLFTAFEQADGGTTRKFGGTGLGLAITRRLAELLGGEIRVSSQPGRGSVFEVRLPLVEAPVPTAAPVAARPAAGPRLAGLRLLVAEDNEVNRLVLEDLLSNEGARVAVADNGQQAIDRLAADPAACDLVLMDIQMPGMDGFEATRRLLALAPTLPVVGQTAHVLAEDREKCLAAGMVDHLAKPIDLERLVEVVLRHTGRPPAPAPAAAEAPPPPPATALIDWTALQRRYPGKAEFVARLLQVFMRANAGLPADLLAAIEAGDSDRLAALTHKLKGASGEIMATALAALTVEVQAALRAERPDAFQRGAELIGLLAATLDEIRSRIAS